MRIKLFFLFFLVVPFAYSQNTNAIFDIARKGTLIQIEEKYKLDSTIINAVNGNGFTPLILACYSGNNSVARFLVEKGCNIDYTSPMGTALMAAVVRGNTEMVSYLLEHQAAIDSVDDNGVTALMFAVKFSQLETTKLLLKHKADKTKTDKLGKTAFEYAVASGRDEIINLLK